MTCYHLEARLRPGTTSAWCPDCQKNISWQAVLEGARDWARAEIESLRKAVFGGGSYFTPDLRAVCLGGAAVMQAGQGHTLVLGEGFNVRFTDPRQPGDVGVCNLGATPPYNPMEQLKCPVICYGEPYTQEVILGWDIWPTLQMLTRREYPEVLESLWEVRSVKGHLVGSKRFGDLDKDDFPLHVTTKVGYGG
jgi:hypothetical protein